MGPPDPQGRRRPPRLITTPFFRNVPVYSGSPRSFAPLAILFACIRVDFGQSAWVAS